MFNDTALDDFDLPPVETLKGRRYSVPKLTAEAVQAIRLDPRPAKVIAAERRIGYSTVTTIKRGDGWRDAE